MSRVASRDATFDGLFREQYASATIGEGLQSRGDELGKAVERLQHAHAGKFASVSVTSERLEIALEMGRPAHVPVETVTELLPAMVAFARLLEEIAGSP
jgi:hypothetical protein